MQRPLPMLANILSIVKSIPLGVIHLLPVMLVTRTIILRLEDRCLLRETTAIILSPLFAGVMWMITECVGLIHLPGTSLALATMALRTQSRTLVAIHLRHLETMTDMTGAPLLPMIDMVVILSLPLL
jgi:hypothetical protein